MSDRDETATAATVTDSFPGVAPPTVTLRAAAEDGNRYELRDEIARGGGGRVVRAYDRKLGREVAIKFPHDDDEGQALRLRLEREARVLAGLEHPAIVPIHDAGVWTDGQPYFAMRLLSNRTLRDAMRAAPGFEQRLALLPLAEAIAGAMAYAHGHGVIHRDLKPGNVVVGELGDTVVIDWGLARRLDEPALESAAITAPGAPRRDDSLATDPTAAAALTATGAVMGTPAYMAPEQARGEPADTRTDVYAIGVILYELLAGVRPHQGDDSVDVAGKILAGPPPRLGDREPRVRRELVAIVEKAMARDVGDRYRDAGELAEDLDRYRAGRLVAAHRYSRAALAGRWVRRRALLLASGVAVAAIGSAAVFALSSSAAPTPDETCRGAAEPARARWNAAVAARIAERFRATGLGGADATFAAVNARLAARVERIGAMRVDACLAHARGEQSGPALDLRMSCLDRRLGQIDAVVAVLDAPDAAVIDAAPQLVSRVGEVDDCANLALLTAVTPLPDDPAARARIAALRARLDAVQAGMDAGKITTREPLTQIVTEARALGYEPLTALALQRAGVDREDESRADNATAEAELRESIVLAEASADDRTRLGALIALYGLIGSDRARDRESLALLAQAEALARRTGATADLATLRGRQTVFHRERGEHDAAIARGREGIALLTAMSAPPADRLTTVRYELQAALALSRRYDEAIAELELAEAGARAVYGEKHHSLVLMMASRAHLLALTGHYDDAIALYQRALAIAEQAAPGSRLVATTLFNLGNTLNMIDREHDGIAVLERGQAVAEALYGHDHPLVVSFLKVTGEAHLYLEEYGPALAKLREALAISERIVGAADPGTTEVRYRLAETLRASDHLAEAAEEYRRTLELMDSRSEPHPERAHVLGGVAMTLFALERWTEAAAAFERAAPLIAAAGDASVIAMNQFGLAQSLVNAGRDRDRAIALARQARAGLAAHQDEQSVAITAMIDTWLAKHAR